LTAKLEVATTIGARVVSVPIAIAGEVAMPLAGTAIALGSPSQLCHNYQYHMDAAGEGSAPNEPFARRKIRMNQEVASIGIRARSAFREIGRFAPFSRP